MGISFWNPISRFDAFISAYVTFVLCHGYIPEHPSAGKRYFSKMTQVEIRRHIIETWQVLTFRNMHVIFLSVNFEKTSCVVMLPPQYISIEIT